MKTSPILDANLNRATEGLRVIEEYTRFIAGNKPLTEKLAKLRKKIAHSETPNQKTSHLAARNTKKDMRANEPPKPRQDLYELLKANFKRAEEAMRVLEEYTGAPLYTEVRYDLYDLEKEILLNLLKPQINPGVYLISHDLEVLKKGLSENAAIIQLRDKDASKSDLLQKAKAIAPIAKAAKIPFVVNDHLDIALLSDADGLHTGQDDLSLLELRTLLGPHKLLGRTTHDLEQGLSAQAAGADYISIGPIWDTPSKPGRPGIGFDYLKSAAEKIDINYVAIGGVNIGTLAEILRYTPPLIGFIRDHENLPQIIEQVRQMHEKKL